MRAVYLDDRRKNVSSRRRRISAPPLASVFRPCREFYTRLILMLYNAWVVAFPPSASG